MTRYPAYHDLLLLATNAEKGAQELTDSETLQRDFVVRGTAEELRRCADSIRYMRVSAYVSRIAVYAERIPCPHNTMLLYRNTPQSAIESEVTTSWHAWKGWHERVFVSLIHLLWAIRDLRSKADIYDKSDIEQIIRQAELLRTHIEFVPSERHKEILEVIAERGPIRLDDLEFSLSWGRATVVRYAAELAELGFVAKTPAGYSCVNTGENY